MSTTDLSNNTMSENEEKVDIWYEKPNVLLTNINEILPLNTMNFNQKINALVRLVILLTILAYFFGQSVKYLFSGALSLVFIYAYSFYCNNEGFELYKDYIDENDLENPDVFQPPTSSNPFSNLLISDIKYNPKKKPGLPAYKPEIEEEINNTVKESIQEMNPDFPNINDRLFKNLGDELEFSKSFSSI